MAAGVDTESVLTQSDASCLASNGQTFVMRYYKDNGSPQLTNSEAVAISAGGLRIGVVFETDPTDISYFTSAQGTSDAHAAVLQGVDVGQPADSAIYFAVDFDATATQAAGAIKTYFQAVFNEIAEMQATMGTPGYAIGVYGDGAVCSEIKENSGLAQFSWLAGASSWYGSDTYTSWNLKQGSSSTTICGISVDPDNSSGVFGGFTV